LIAESTQLVKSGTSLEQDQMTQVIDTIMRGDCTNKQIESLLVALHEKGETVEELAGAASAMRMHMNPIETRRDKVVDTCGTGGGKSGTFNISTAAAIVAAAAGASVAKHGNRKSTSKSGRSFRIQRSSIYLGLFVILPELRFRFLGPGVQIPESILPRRSHCWVPNVRSLFTRAMGWAKSRFRISRTSLKSKVSM